MSSNSPLTWGSPSSKRAASPGWLRQMMRTLKTVINGLRGPTVTIARWSKSTWQNSSPRSRAICLLIIVVAALFAVHLVSVIIRALVQNLVVPALLIGAVGILVYAAILVIGRPSGPRRALVRLSVGIALVLMAIVFARHHLAGRGKARPAVPVGHAWLMVRSQETLKIKVDGEQPPSLSPDRPLKIDAGRHRLCVRTADGVSTAIEQVFPPGSLFVVEYDPVGRQVLIIQE